MVKKKGSKAKKKGSDLGQPATKLKKVKVRKVKPKEVLVSGPAAVALLANPAEASSSDPISNSNGGVSNSAEKEKGVQKRTSGFIFMCNPSTKLECFQYRVFGLPMGQKEVVEEIKPGAKLFLFDFKLKLLYGIYEASSAGEMNLEPAAFGGKFPAQVKFKIFKECLPLPENSLRQIIKENYNGSKFKQELSGKQVKKLVSSFRSLAASSAQLAPRAPPTASVSRAVPHLAMENQFRQTVRLLPEQAQYLTRPQYSQVTSLEPPIGPNVHFTHQRYHRTSSNMALAYPTLNRQIYPATGNYYVPNPHPPYVPQDVTHEAQDPYSRYRTVEERSPNDQATNLVRQYLQLPLQRESLYRDDAVAYNPYPQAPTSYNLSVTEPQLPAPAGRIQGSTVVSSYYPYSGATR